jgi:hypothetical protein
VLHLKKDMKSILNIFILFGLLSCSNGLNEKDKTEFADIATKEFEEEYHPEGATDNIFREIVLYETKIDSLDLPFPEKDMLSEIQNQFKPYTAERKIGEQDGPNYEYIEILRENKQVAFFDFNWENSNQLEEIRITNSAASDQYGVRVGDSYKELKIKRPQDFKNSTNYHQHTYLYSDDSNIYYELTGDFSLTSEMIENIEDLKLTEQQLSTWMVEYILWRLKN